MPRSSLFACLFAALWTSPVAAAGANSGDAATGQSAGNIEQLLKLGWDVAGYSSNSDNRSTFILFKKAGETYLVQCLTGYDVTREPRVFENCYHLR